MSFQRPLVIFNGITRQIDSINDNVDVGQGIANTFGNLTIKSGAGSVDTDVGFFTTAGLNPADFGYVSSAFTLTQTDADALVSSYAVGMNIDVGVTRIAGTVVATFTTAGGMPVVGAPVYLAPGTEEAGAAGKLTATKPSAIGQFVAEIGIVLDNSNYGPSKQVTVLLQVKAVVPV